MQSPASSPEPDHGAPALASVVTDVLDLDAAMASVEARRVRALARAGRLAIRGRAGRPASSREADLALREVASEIGAAEHLSDRTVQAQIRHAMLIAESFPATLDAWQSGALARAHVHVITDIGATLPAERHREFDALAAAEAEGLSPGLLRTRLAALAEQLQPTTLTERHRAGRARRNVRVVRGDDGMSDLIATLPTVLAVGIYDRLMQQSRALVDARDARPPVTATRDSGEASRAPAGGAPVSGRMPQAPPAPDVRTPDQVRADLLADLLLTAAPLSDPTRDDDGPGTLGAIRARVQVVVPALTMLDPGRENADPAELVGHGPIDAATARRLAESTTRPWDRVITHPITGAVLHVDTYQRTAAIDRYLRARDRHCRWPGCTAPAIRCEVDHTHDHALGGRTETGNLAHLCQRHHTQKQFTAWRVRQREGGVLEWTSPTGRTYVDEPLPYPPAVAFVPGPRRGAPPPHAAPRPSEESPGDG